MKCVHSHWEEGEKSQEGERENPEGKRYFDEGETGAPRESTLAWSDRTFVRQNIHCGSRGTPCNRGSRALNAVELVVCGWGRNVHESRTGLIHGAAIFAWNGLPRLSAKWPTRPLLPVLAA